MPVKSVSIIGAGIAGLALALSLARKGIRSEIAEQATELKEVGAGLQLSPNATRILAELGVLRDIRMRWTEPDSIDLVSGTTLRTLVRIPVGMVAETRWQAPYGVLHRATLQKVLLDAVMANPLCTLHLGLRAEPRDGHGIRAVFSETPEVVVGADGVWSRVRSLIPGSPTSRFSGNVAWRVVIPFDQAPEALDRTRVRAFTGPGAHLVTYPLKDAGGFNIVAITGGFDPGETWEARAERGRAIALRDHFGGWHPQLAGMLSRHDDLLYWPLCQATDGAWQDGKGAVLIGDAAHAMMPFMAQGAASAIEDAFVLANCLAGLPLPNALSRFEEIRKPRAKKLRERAEFNRMVYHARGPLRVGRDLALSLRRASAFLKDLDWIYGHRAA